jgi:gamma-glutamylcyclotransferase (GGCT)/AIG2-like uncharacterized protein YtfP
MNLFVYGTLMVPEVMSAVCGYDLPGVPATVEDFSRRRVTGESYPAIMPSPGDTVSGMLYLDVSSSQLDALDAFEGSMYRRCGVQVRTGSGDVEAAAYVIADGCQALLTDDAWSLEAFVDQHLSAFMSDYQGFLAMR